MENLTIEQQIEKLKLELKNLKSQSKPKKQKVGIPVRFYTKDKTEIVGMGQLYYVVNLNGKLYYKESSQVELLEKLPE